MIIWLASYPRSGNTFFRVLMNSVFSVKTYSIYNDRFDIGADKKTSDVVGHEFLPEDFNIEEARASDEIYIIKTHGKPSVDMANDKTIYLYRDGREATNSYLQFKKKFGNENKKRSNDNLCLEDIIAGNVVFGGWGEHVDAWSPAERKNTLLVRFEDLVSEPESLLKSIGEFINLSPKGNQVPSFNELKAVNPRFFSSGKKDSWKEYFTLEQEQYFNLKNNKQLQYFGYERLDKGVDFWLPYFESFLIRNKTLRESDVELRERIEAASELQRNLSNQHKLDLDAFKAKTFKIIEEKDGIISRERLELSSVKARLFKDIEEKDAIISRERSEIIGLKKYIDEKIEIEKNLELEILSEKNKLEAMQEKTDFLEKSIAELLDIYKQLKNYRAIFSPLKKYGIYRELSLYLLAMSKFDD